VLAALAPGCHRDPDAAAWRAAAAQPAATALPLAQAWDVAAPFCPQEITPASAGLAALHAPDRAALVQVADGSPADSPAPIASPPGERDSPAVQAVDANGAFGGRTALAVWDRLALFALPDSGRLVAFDLKRGKVAWEFRAAAGVVVAPQLVRGRVLLESLDNHLYCLLAKNGHEVWRARAAARLTRPAADWRDRALVIAEGSPTVEAFDLRDGAPAGKWTLPAPDVRFVAGPRVVGDLMLAAYAAYGSPECRLVGLRLTPAPPG
jgi:putative pyrroloquinoline-quinone binding quinoprotein